MKNLSLLTGVLCLTAILPAQAAESEQQATDKVIVLPETKISEKMKLRPEEKWLTGTIGNFEIFSHASERETRTFISEFYKFHQAFIYLFPKSDVKLANKLKLVLCGSTDKFTALAPANYNNLSTMVSDGNDCYLLIDLAVKSRFTGNSRAYVITGDTWIPGGDGLFGPSPYDFIDGSVLARREYIHFLSERANPRPPLWFEEGIAMYFSSMEITKNKITYARLGKDVVTWLDGPSMLPMEKFFALPKESGGYNPNFSRQALVFVHYTMFARKMLYQKSLLAFADKASLEPVTEEMFRRYFGMSLNDMEGALLSYIKDGGFFKYVVAPKKIKFPIEPAYELRATTDVENGLLKGNILRLVKRYEDANAELMSPILRKHSDIRLVAALGVLEYNMGNFSAARKHLEDAVAAKVDDCTAYITLARLRLHEALKAAVPAGALNADQMSDVLTPLFAARALDQPLPDIYSLIADIWEYSHITPSQDNLAILDDGVQKFPRNSDLVYKDAVLKGRYKFYNDAHALIDLGLRHARDQKTQDRFTKLRADLPQATESVQ